ncbi:DUF2865 domain-containing protein [Devosia sp.]|uniref:DUF2865 domain-containing protein n=1 Tax=Devosia sp. TaxID=1871048 RepID=UPI0032643A41
MIVSSRVAFRGLLAMLALCAALALDVSDAYAQSANCSRLQQSLASFDRNGDFRSVGGNTQNARDLARQVQAAESSYIRNGCNDDAKAGRTLTRQCQGIGHDVLRLRDQYAKVASSVETGNAVAQQREAILQELARFGCGADQGGSSATFTNERQGVFDRIFGTSNDPNYQDGTIVGDDDIWGDGSANTVRTVCVRLSDGYFWPVSYSTLPDMVGNDAAVCSQQCPGTPTQIYYYDNPGQEAEDMRNLFNERYTALPNAFRYRREFDKTSTCKPAPVAGNITQVSDANGQMRSMVTLDGGSFPLPLRDPRRALPVAAPVAPVKPVQPVEAPLQTAQLLDIPLPRPRPPGPGESPIAKAVVPEDGDKTLRLVQFGDKVVRVVGPDTPYAQPAEAGT